jgi:hypothetical protein
METHTPAAVTSFRPSYLHDDKDPPTVAPIAPKHNSQITTSDIVNGLTNTDSKNSDLDAARHSLSQLSIDDPDWLDIAWTFACDLEQRFEETSSNNFLMECISLRRQICVVCRQGNRGYVESLGNLAIALRTNYNMNGDETLQRSDPISVTSIFLRCPGPVPSRMLTLCL